MAEAYYMVKDKFMYDHELTAGLNCTICLKVLFVAIANQFNGLYSLQIFIF